MKRILLALLIISLSLFYSGCTNQQGVTITKEKAVEFVMEDLKNNHPGADIDIYLVVPEDDNWKITSKVIYGSHSPCPNLTTIVYNYPKFGFEPREQNVITDRCEVLSCKGIPNCKITLEEEAIIASHTFNSIQEVDIYRSTFGDSNIKVYATPYTIYVEPKNNQTYNNVWVVEWTSLEANRLIRLVINQTGGKLIDKFIEPRG
jgi:hypothetical protein